MVDKTPSLVVKYGPVVVQSSILIMTARKLYGQSPIVEIVFSGVFFCLNDASRQKTQYAKTVMVIFQCISLTITYNTQYTGKKHLKVLKSYPFSVFYLSQVLLKI